MCFSAGASFGASALLGGMAIVTIAKAKTTPQRLFATIPLFFSVQQLSEGILWLSLKNPVIAEWQGFFIYTFLLFAMAIWPLLIPLTIRLLEKNEKQKKIMNVLTGIGIAVSIAVCFILFLTPVQVMPSPHHLHYQFDLMQPVKNLLWLFTILYILATIITPFFSSIKKMKWLGVCFFASYLVSMIFYKGFVISVWCYFAAILSIIVLWIVLDLRKMNL
ncbi:MAG: DUF6629 family protein [Chitinophagaceae bacterium]